jgi:threonylcarbamoyladenosine tRNA methylthiotransferase MtaB
MSQPTVAFTTLGCRLNQAESDAMAQDLAARGVGAAKGGAAPDLVVVNTCTVTTEATKASRAAIRRALRSHPEARVVVIGCYVVSDRHEVEAMEGVDAVLGNDDKERFVASLEGRAEIAPLLQIGPPPERVGRSRLGRVRANLKVQTGCDEWCSFCIIPMTRGPLRSMDEDALLQQAHAMIAAGAREIVLTGVHLGKYSYDRGGDERDLVRLLSRLLDIDGLWRLRLSSILSNHLTDEVVDLMAREPRICRHLHVPLQSGDDGVLEAMHRPYRVRDYVDAVRRVRDRIAGVALATDIIVGFPGESDDAFGATMAVAEAIGFSKLHVFRYSARPGTDAARRDDEVPPDIKRQRSKRLIELGNEMRQRFLAAHLARPLEVLVEDERVVDGVTVCSGQTSDYVRVWFEGKGLLGSVVEVVGEAVRADGVEGRLPGT